MLESLNPVLCQGVCFASSGETYLEGVQLSTLLSYLTFAEFLQKVWIVFGV